VVSTITSVSQKTEVLSFYVEAGKYQRINTPVSLDLAGIIVNDSLSVQLFELVNGKQVEVPCQIEPDIIQVVVDPERNYSSRGKARLCLYRNTFINYKKSVTAVVSSKMIELKKDQTKILDYQIALRYPPAGIDTMYKRNGFIHPMFSPSGNILTRIDAPDHWASCRNMEPMDKSQDRKPCYRFLESHLHEGTVKFAGINSTTDGPVFGGLMYVRNISIFRVKTTMNLH